MTRHSAVFIPAACMIILLALIQTAGCGKKTPLVLPEKPDQALAAPENLKAVVSDSRITLTWTYEADPENAAPAPGYFEISMAIPRDCEGCPLVFRTVGRTAMPGMAFEIRVADPATPRYFRVHAVGDNSIRSEYSSTVVVAE